jgi:hypothetical protein
VATKPLPARIGWPTRNDAMLVPSPTTRVTAASTNALAANTVRRRGTAVKVVRIMPLAYSPVIASTASATTAIWLT